MSCDLLSTAKMSHNSAKLGDFSESAGYKLLFKKQIWVTPITDKTTLRPLILICCCNWMMVSKRKVIKIYFAFR